MGPSRDRQGPAWPHVGHMNFVIWVGKQALSVFVKSFHRGRSDVSLLLSYCLPGVRVMQWWDFLCKTKISKITLVDQLKHLAWRYENLNPYCVAYALRNVPIAYFYLYLGEIQLTVAELLNNLCCFIAVRLIGEPGINHMILNGSGGRIQYQGLVNSNPNMYN